MPVAGNAMVEARRGAGPTSCATAVERCSGRGSCPYRTGGEARMPAVAGADASIAVKWRCSRSEGRRSPHPTTSSMGARGAVMGSVGEAERSAEGLEMKCASVLALFSNVAASSTDHTRTLPSVLFGDTPEKGRNESCCVHRAALHAAAARCGMTWPWGEVDGHARRVGGRAGAGRASESEPWHIATSSIPSPSRLVLISASAVGLLGTRRRGQGYHSNLHLVPVDTANSDTASSTNRRHART